MSLQRFRKNVSYIRKITDRRQNVDHFVQASNMMLTYHHASHTRWRYWIETFPALLALCAGNSPVDGEFPAQRPVTRSFDVFFDLRLNKRLSKQSWNWWFETPSRPLWRQCNGWMDSPKKASNVELWWLVSLLFDHQSKLFSDTEK